MAIDLSTIVASTTKIAALNDALTKTTDPSARAFLQAEIAVETAGLSANAQHQQAQADASANLLNGLGLFATLTQVVGTGAPTILTLFKGIGR